MTTADIFVHNRVILTHFDRYSTALLFPRWEKSLLWPAALPDGATPMPSPAISQGAPQGLANVLTGKQTIIVQTDGAMLPAVQYNGKAGDKRKNKSVQWAEAKISLAHVAGSKEMSFAATLQGDVQLAGKQLRKCARRVGLGKAHWVHGLGDGAPWIARQVKKNFGQQRSYLVDFFHVCDYLSAAAQAVATDSAAQQVWLAQQKQRLKTGGLDALLNELQENLESTDTPEEMAPCTQVLAVFDSAPGSA